MQLDFPVPKGPLRPSNSKICPRTAPEIPPKAPQIVHIGRRSPKPKTDGTLGYVAQKAISRTPNAPATTHFGWFPPLKVALNDTENPYPLGYSKVQEVPQRGGSLNGSTRSTGCKNRMALFKNDLGVHGMPKQVFLARLDLVVARFGPPRLPQCLENGLFSDKIFFKIGSKMHFSNNRRSVGVK